MVTGKFLCMEVQKNSPIGVWDPPKPAQLPVCSGFEPFVHSAGYNWLLQLVQGNWTGTLKWSHWAVACSADSGHCFLPRKNLEYCEMCSVSLPVFSSLHEPISSFFPHFFHGWDAVQPGHACEELQLQVRRSGGCQQTPAQGGHGIREPKHWDAALFVFFFSFFYRLLCDHQQLWKLPFISSSLLPKPLALQKYCKGWFTKVLWGLGCEILWQKKAFQLFIASHILNHGKLD